MKKIKNNFFKLKTSVINNYALLIVLFLIIAGFFYRLYGLNENSFWSDEAHVAIFVRAILKRGEPILNNGYSTGIYQCLQYWLSAISAKIFGLNEFAIRFPTVIFGILTIWAVYLLGKELFNKNVGLLAAFFTTFLKIEILWSRQTRPYQSLQFFFVLGAWFLYRLTKSKNFNNCYFLAFLMTGILASLMHGLGLLIFLIGFIYIFFSHPNWFKNKLLLTLSIIFCSFLFFFYKDVIIVSLLKLKSINNFFYFRVFITHNYLLLSFFAFIGFIFSIIEKRRNWFLPILFIIVQTLACTFLFTKYIRYFYPVFPFIIILAAYGIISLIIFIKSWLIKKTKLSYFLIYTLIFLFAFLLISSVILPKNKFTFRMQKVYFLNEDMQEIPEVDWDKIYGFVGNKMRQNPGTVLASNWNDLPIWYLGEGKLNYMVTKLWKENLKKDTLSSAMMIYSLDDFKKIIKINKKGIFVIDSWDSRIPEGVRVYVKNNLKKELEIDRLYPVQPRLWLVEVYSWGNLK